MDEDRREILDRAYRILDDTAGIEPRQVGDPNDDAMVRWERMRAQSQPQPAPARRNAAPDDENYRRWARVLSDPWELRNTLGYLVYLERKARRGLDVKIQQLRRELDQARSDLDSLRAELSVARAEIKQHSAATPTILSWQFDRRHYRAVPTMSDGKPGAPLDLRPFFEMYHHETAE